MIAVNGVDVAFGPNEQFPNLAALEAALTGFGTEASAVAEGDVVTVRVGILPRRQQRRARHRDPPGGLLPSI
ncbi:MAG: hypothetical protein R3F65_13360 [bacterium]